MTTDNTEKKFQKSLANLHSISGLVNDLDVNAKASLPALLKLIADSSIQLVENSSAVIYKIDLGTGMIDPTTRVFVSGSPDPIGFGKNDLPRPDGLGYRSITRKERVVSYEENDTTLHPTHLINGVHAAVCFPLMIQRIPQGILYLYLHEQREFTDWEILQIEIFVNQAAMAIYQANAQNTLRDDLEKKEGELRQLQTATKVLFSKQNLSETLNSILTLALEMTNAHYGIFRLVDDHKRNLVTYSYAGADMRRPKIESLPINEHSVMGRVASTRSSILINDILEEQFDYYPLADDMKMRSELALPLINANGGLEGVINLESPNPKAFSVHHKLMVETLCTFAVIAINEFRLLESLVEITQSIGKTPLDHLARLILTRTGFLFNAEICDLWELSNEGKPRSVGSSDRSPEMDSEVSMSKDDQRVWIKEKYVGMANTLRLIELSAPAGKPKTYILALALRQRRELTQNDQRILYFLESFIDLALENERWNEKLAIEQQQRLVAETFAAVGDVASNVLHTVNNRVGLIPVKIQSLQVKRAELLQGDLYLAKSLNDIGKFAVEALNTVSENMQNLRPLEVSQIDLVAVVDETVRRFTEQSDVTISIIKPEEPIFIAANHKNLIFICQNIIDNAIRAMDGKGNISIKISEKPGEARVRIRDDGPGMETKVLENLFEFSSSNNDHARLGFGLWWVKTMMARLGGRVRVESVVGQGSSFILYFPIGEKK